MTTTPDFRALCAELLDCIEKANWPLRHKIIFELCVDRARTALATPPPEPPTDEELLKAVRHLYGDQISADMGADDDLLTARAVLDRLG